MRVREEHSIGARPKRKTEMADVMAAWPPIVRSLGIGSRRSELGPGCVKILEATAVAPWFLMQPGMGLGVLARNAPGPGIVRAHSLSSHIAFGAGLYAGVLII